MLVRFKKLYEEHIVKYLNQKFQYKNFYQIPKLLKIVVSIGAGDAGNDSKVMSNIVNDLSLITGQKPYITTAKKSIAAFKLREGMKIGCKVTLRKNKMYEFLERLAIIALPRVKEFKGFSSSNFDGRGNLCFGLKEQIVFPEINYDKIDKVRGMNIVIVTSARKNEEGKALLSQFNLPFYN